MRRLIPIFLTAVAVFIGSLAHGATKAPSRAAKAEFQALLDNAIASVEKKDFDSLKSFFRKDEPIVILGDHRFADMVSMKIFWDEQFYGRVIPVKRVAVSPVGELIVEYISDDVALLSGTAKTRILFQNDDSRSQMVYFTAVAKKSENDWHLMTFHCSVDNLQVHSRVHTYHIAAAAMLLGLALGAALLMALRKLDSGISDA